MQKPGSESDQEPVVASKLFAAAGSAEEAQSGGRSAWRISSTMFTTLCHDTLLEPIGVFASEPTVRSQLATTTKSLPARQCSGADSCGGLRVQAGDYTPMKAGKQVALALEEIGLASQKL